MGMFATMLVIPVLTNIECILEREIVWWRKFTGYLIEFIYLEGMDEETMLGLIRIEQFAWVNGSLDRLDKDLDETLTKMKEHYFNNTE